MSATGRGGVYLERAAYYTPLPLARFLLGLLPVWDRPRRVLEPHAGSGSFLTAALELESKGGVFHRLYALDIDPTAKGVELARAEGGWGAVGCFLSTPLPARPDVIVGNPPYSEPQAAQDCPKCEGRRSIPYRDGTRSKECPRCDATGSITPKPVAVAHLHIRRALKVVAPGGHVAFLLRLGIVEGRDRFPLFRDHPPRKVFALSSRPSFVGGSSDQTSYGFFHWQQGYQGPTEFEVVDWNPAE